MKIFKCPICASRIFFENYSCHNCNTVLGFSPKNLEFVAINPFKGAKYCANETMKICNWIVTDAETDTYCKACAVNRIVPGNGDLENFEKWKRIEIAKHRLIYQLILLNLPMIPKIDNEKIGLAFDFLRPNNKKKKLTGHQNGVITIILSEGDSVHIEQVRKSMSEAYRTLIGHFRHEIAHYYWPLLYNFDLIDKYRALFGDERLDYSKALKKYYKFGAPANWNRSFITKYATAHSSEDWAETCAHYFHIMDILETAYHCNVSIDHTIHDNDSYRGHAIPEPYNTRDFKILHEASVVLTITVNSLNRSMGIPDIYPFTIPKPVIEKLTFIHEFFWEMRDTVEVEANVFDLE